MRWLKGVNGGWWDVGGALVKGGGGCWWVRVGVEVVDGRVRDGPDSCTGGRAGGRTAGGGDAGRDGAGRGRGGAQLDMAGWEWHYPRLGRRQGICLFIYFLFL